MQNDVVPVEIITGFLGSGKTTHINDLIRKKGMKDAIILVNDFGEVNVDASLIEYQDDKIQRLTNGCMCCSLSGSLAEQIHSCLTLTSERPKIIYIETSGVTRPQIICDVVNLSNDFKLSQVTCLVDASAIDKNKSSDYTSDIWSDQILNASTILLNRLPEDSTLVRQLIYSMNSSAVIELGSKQEDKIESACLLSGKIVSKIINLNIAVNKDRLSDIFDHYKCCLIRAKGVLKVYEKKPYNVANVVVQLSSEKLVFIPSSLLSGSLVLIGIESWQFDSLSDEIKSLQE